MLTESRDVLRPWQRLIPTVDANVVFREACTACGMRYAVEPNTTGVHAVADVNSADHMDDAARR